MGSLKQDMIYGLVWSAIGKYSGLVVSIIISAILARLLSPNEFGIIAVATVIIHFLSIFSTFGIGPAVIQRKDLSEKDIDYIYSFSVFLSFFIAILFALSSPIIATIYNNSVLIPICVALSFNLLFVSLNMVPGAMMARNLRFKDVAKITLFAQASTGFISCLAAYYGAGVYSLLISPILSSIVIFNYNRKKCNLNLYYNFSLKPVKSIISFSSYQFAFEFFNYFSRNLDKLIIGKYISSSALGYYDKSYRLMQLPMNNISSVISPVLQPVMSSLQDKKSEMAEKYNKMIKMIAVFSFPLGAFLFFSGKEIIRIFYGNNWDPAIPSFRILSISIPLQLILSTTGGIFQSCNATNHLFYAGLRNTIITVSGFIIASFYYGSIEAIAWAWTITSFFCFFSSFVDLYYFIFKCSLINMLILLIKPLVISLTLSVLLFLISEIDNINIFSSLILKIIIFIIIWILGLIVLYNYKIKDVIMLKFHSI